ncbi:HTH domain-containing protein [Streptomyces phytophilus]|uniref:HTH domain-containing protein n=1 Tax=Streptomyces phytophilus TaxID=722715 RepID=UPI0015F065EF|nr:HTH domain-containing protein [Streptomyces phytophilus]
MSRLSDDRAARLPEVRRLKAQGLSQRAIARRLQVSQSAIARDVQDLKKEQRAMAHTDSAADSPPGDSTDSAALDRVADALTDDSPAEHRRLTLYADDDLIRDLADLMDGTQCSPQQLIDYAVGTLANTYRAAVAHGALRPGDELAVTAMTIRRPAHHDTVAVTLTTPPA